MTTAGSYLRTSWRSLVMVVAFLGMLTVGYLTMSVATSCPAQAQVCSCGICVLQGKTAVSAVFLEISAQTATQIGIATGIINTQYALAAEAFGLQAAARFGQVIIDIMDWFDTYWYYNEKPAMQAMTEQANVMDAIQTATMSTFRDGAEMLRTQHVMSELRFQSERELQTSEQLCVVGSVSGSLARAHALTDAYGRAAAADAARRSGGEKGTSGERGTAADIAARWQDVRTRYCDPDENNGQNTCVSSGGFVNADIDVAGSVFEKDTIDVTDPAVRHAVDTLVANIAEPFIENNIPESQLATTVGIQRQLERDEVRAKRQTIHSALQYTIARRAPASGNGAFVAAIRDTAGIPPDLLSNNPSYHEIMDAMLVERYRSGQYTLDQADTPANAERDVTVQNAFQVMQMHDYLELLDRYALMLAAQTGIEVRNTRSGDGELRAE